MGSYMWSGPNVTGNEFDPKGLTEGDHEIFVIYEEDNCQGDSSFMVNITLTPEANFSVDRTTICVGETVNILYEGSQLTNQTISWISSGGETVMPGANANEYMVTFDSDGTFDIQLDVMNGDCPTAPATATITVEPELVFNDIACNPALDQVTFTWDPVDCATDYEVFITIGSGAEVSQGIQSTREYTESGLPVNTEVFIRVVAISDCACGDVEANGVCETTECVNIDINLFTMDGIYEFCNTDDLTPVEIIAEAIGTQGNGSFVWSGPGVDQTGMFDPLAAGVGTHTIYYDFLESAGCPHIDSIMFTINELPQVTLQYEDINCFDQTSTTLEVFPTGGSGVYTITLDGGTGDTINDVTAGTHDVIVTDENLCTAMASVTIPTPNEPVPSISGATELLLGDSSTYSIDTTVFTGTTIDSIVWSANGTVICNDPGCFLIRKSNTN